MKKVIILVTGYIGISIALFIIQSCDLLSYDTWIQDIKFTGINATHNSKVDSLTNNIEFKVTALTSKAQALNVDSWGLFKNAYATTKAAKWQNDLDISSY